MKETIIVGICHDHRLQSAFRMAGLPLPAFPAFSGSVRAQMAELFSNLALVRCCVTTGQSVSVF